MAVIECSMCILRVMPWQRLVNMAKPTTNRDRTHKASLIARLAYMITAVTLGNVAVDTESALWYSFPALHNDELGCRTCSVDTEP